jgi:hypothetical protein
VKDINTIGKKMAKNGRKTAIYQLQIFAEEFLINSQDGIPPHTTFCVINFEPNKIRNS